MLFMNNGSFSGKRLILNRNKIGLKKTIALTEINAMEKRRVVMKPKLKVEIYYD